jgi:hypothetical protein
MPGFGANAVTVRAMRHDSPFFVLIPLFLMVVGARVIKQIWLREEAKPVAKARRGLTPNCEKELRRTVIY